MANIDIVVRCSLKAVPAAEYNPFEAVKDKYYGRAKNNRCRNIL